MAIATGVVLGAPMAFVFSDRPTTALMVITALGGAVLALGLWWETRHR